MSDVKHTPGPWQITPGMCPGADGFTGPTIHGGDGEWVVAVLDSGNGPDAERDDIWRDGETVTAANAAIIAAAPDLLKKLVKARNQIARDAAKLGPSIHGRNLAALAEELSATIAKASSLSPLTEEQK